MTSLQTLEIGKIANFEPLKVHEERNIKFIAKVLKII
jgi:hypothetical protein